MVVVLFTINDLLFTVIPVPSPLSGSRRSSARTSAAVLSFLLKLPWAELPVLPQTDRRARSDRAGSERHVHANETSGPIACPVECAVVLCHSQSALRSSRPARLRAQ